MVHDALVADLSNKSAHNLLELSVIGHVLAGELGSKSVWVPSDLSRLAIDLLTQKWSGLIPDRPKSTRDKTRQGSSKEIRTLEIPIDEDVETLLPIVRALQETLHSVLAEINGVNYWSNRMVNYETTNVESRNLDRFRQAIFYTICAGLALFLAIAHYKDCLDHHDEETDQLQPTGYEETELGLSSPPQPNLPRMQTVVRQPLVHRARA